MSDIDEGPLHGDGVLGKGKRTTRLPGGTQNALRDALAEIERLKKELDRLRAAGSSTYQSGRKAGMREVFSEMSPRIADLEDERGDIRREEYRRGYRNGRDGKEEKP